MERSYPFARPDRTHGEIAIDLTAQCD